MSWGGQGASGNVAAKWNQTSSSRKESSVSAADAATRSHMLANLFDTFAEGTDNMTEEQLKNCCRSCDLLDNKIAEIDVSVIFSGVKLGKKQTINYELYQEAFRKIAVKKGIFFTELVTKANTNLQAARGTDGEDGFSAAHASSVIQAGGIAAKKKQMFEKKKAPEDGYSSKMASRHRKFGGGTEVAKGSATGFSAANAKMMALRGGGVAHRAAKFGGGGGKAAKNQSSDFNANSAKKDIRSGNAAARAAKFGGPAVKVAGPSGSEGGFSAANAAKEISSGNAAARAAMFGGTKAASQAEEVDDGGFSAANAQKEIAAAGGVAARSAMFKEVQASGSESAGAAEVDLVALQESLHAFYRKLNPENVHKVPELIEKMKGDKKAAKKLNKKLKKKYGLTLQEFEAGMEPELPEAKESSYQKARKQSAVDPGEIRTRDEALKGIFGLYCGPEGEGGMSEADFVRFCVDRELIDDLNLSSADVGLVFSSVKLGGKKEINFTVFMEACRKVALKKEVTFTELVQQARGLA